MADYICRETALKKLQMQLLDLEADQDKGEYSELCENRGARDALDEAIYDIRTLKAADVQPVDRWISVNDRLPDVAEAEVLVWIDDGTADGIKIYNSLHIAYWYGDTKLFYDFHCDEIKGVTHWMYVSAIPEPPKDGDAE